MNEALQELLTALRDLRENMEANLDMLEDIIELVDEQN